MFGRLGYGSKYTRSIVMLGNLIYILSFFSTCGLMIIPSINLSTRIIIFIFSLSILFLSWLNFHLRGEEPFLLSFLSSSKCKTYMFIIAGLFFTSSLFILHSIPETGITLKHSNNNGDITGEITIKANSFNITPDLHPVDYLQKKSGSFHYSASFSIKEPMDSLLFYTSHGDSVWKIDGKEVVHQLKESSVRNSLIPYNLSPGSHNIECLVSYLNPPPHISFVSGKEEPINGPFYHIYDVYPKLFYGFFTFISSLCILIGSFFLIPIINYILLKVSPFIVRYRRGVLFILILVAFFIFGSIRILFSTNTDSFFEADEASFGIMSQRLLVGQSPPLFHYGQSYQGTAESIPLASIFSLFGFSADILHTLPLIFGILFLLITVLTVGMIGGRYPAIFALLVLCVGGLHFHWIISKTWFGYSFSLFCGAILMFLSFYSCKKDRYSPGASLLWGAIAGLCFYELPLSFPFIFVSSFPFFYFCFKGILIDFIRLEKLAYFYKSILRRIYRSGLALAFLGFSICSLPYLLNIIYEANNQTLKFLLEGRNLSSSISDTKAALFDRFFGECLPVLLGARTNYNQVYDIPTVFAPSFPSLLFILSIFIFPFVCYKYFPKTTIIKNLLPLIMVFCLTIITIIAVTFSPFGIWPWYAISLFWSIPFLFYVSIRFIWKLSPALSFLSVVIFLLSTLTGFIDYNFLSHQASSISSNGISLPPISDDILPILSKHNVRYLICDQGFDQSSTVSGKDWIGECLSYSGDRNIISVDRVSRRFTDDSQELINSSRVGYLFHKDYYFNNATFADITGANYSPIFSNGLIKLFGANNLGYNRYNMEPYILFLPNIGTSGINKNKWRLDSTNPIFLSAAVDHNISPRGSGRDCYWSSDIIPSSGSKLSISFPNKREISKIFLFHSIKSSDKTKDNEIFYRDNLGVFRPLGSLHYEGDIHCSVLRLDNPVKTDLLEIRVSKTDDGSWWTIYEMWIF